MSTVHTKLIVRPDTVTFKNVSVFLRHFDVINILYYIILVQTGTLIKLSLSVFDRLAGRYLVIFIPGALVSMPLSNKIMKDARSLLYIGKTVIIVHNLLNGRMPTETHPSTLCYEMN